MIGLLEILQWIIDYSVIPGNERTSWQSSQRSHYHCHQPCLPCLSPLSLSVSFSSSIQVIYDKFATTNQHTAASSMFINTKKLPEISNRSTTEKMMYFHLPIIIFTYLTQLKTQFVCHVSSMKKTLLTSFANVL